MANCVIRKYSISRTHTGNLQLRSMADHYVFLSFDNGWKVSSYLIRIRVPTWKTVVIQGFKYGQCCYFESSRGRYECCGNPMGDKLWIVFYTVAKG